jgi:hypothetical protein
MSTVTGGITNTGNIQRQLEDGINAVANVDYDSYEPEFTKYLEVRRSTKNYETQLAQGAFGFAKTKPEGTPIEYDATQESAPKIYQNVVYALGAIITEEAIDDSRYLDMMDYIGSNLKESIIQTEEQVSANVFNNGYSTSTLGWDQQPLFSDSHLLIKGGTYSNVLPVAADLSEAAIEDMINFIGRYTTDAGLQMKALVETLHIPVELQFTAERILGSPLQSGNGNNDINALRSMSSVPGGFHVCHFFTSPDQWFLKTNVKESGIFFRRKDHTFATDNDFGTSNYRHKASTRFSVGWTDAKGYFANGLIT